jgi:hypothetical protein
LLNVRSGFHSAPFGLQQGVYPDSFWKTTGAD